MYKRVKQRIHFVGIGGIGMSGIAEVLFHQGYPVSGSDLAESENVKRLTSLGLKIEIGHKASNVVGSTVVVISSAVGRDNPELLEAQRLGIPVVPRAEMLAELMRLRFGIAVAGTHGKTTTTSMLASIVAQAGEDPTVIVGGKVDSLGGNAKLGQGKFLIAEADESDGSFLKLSPVVTIITNIDNDHLDFYGQMEKLRMSFLEFANKVPYYGRSILCIDDKETAKLLPLISKPYWTYGFSKEADFVITDYDTTVEGTEFKVHKNGKFLCVAKLKSPGRHNCLNAVAAMAAALELDIEISKILVGLENFDGVKRRFEHKGNLAKPNVRIIDDYGHHPTEIAATLTAAKQSWKYGRVLVAFQPHRYSRTRICWEQFASAFQEADCVWLLDIYAASEAAIHGVDSISLCKKINEQSGTEKCFYAGSIDNAAQLVRDNLKDGDLLITLGAGSITQLGPKILAI